MRLLAKSRRIRPAFAQCWIIPEVPGHAELCTSYEVKGTKVKLYGLPEGGESLYHIQPPEYNLSRLQMELIEHTISELKEHLPTVFNVRHPSKTIDYIENFGHREIAQYIRRRGLNLGRTRTEEINAIDSLVNIISKYTAGFGLIEVLLEDKNVQDIFIDAPVEHNHVYLTMGYMDDTRLSSKFITNIITTNDGTETILSRFRYESGRPFSEAHPILECDNEVFNTRVTVIGAPISPFGTAFALRRHSSDPWTLPKLIQCKSLSPLAAGLISFLIDGQSTILVAGGRGAGKSSLLAAMMFEFSPGQRILTIEDTLELPGAEMQELGYKLQSMQIRSSVRGEGSITADEALKISLRLGESAIVLGEVRGDEARTLYEAMRAGTAGSAVMGTFHANSAKAVFERVVYDMGISAEAFSSTDIVVVAGLIRPSGMHRPSRRVIQLAELVKDKKEPYAFSDLLQYNTTRDELVETNRFLECSDKLSTIAKSWGMSYSEILRNIRVRAKIKMTMVDLAHSSGKQELLTGPWVYSCNSKFWELLQKQIIKNGSVDYELLFDDWKRWFVKAVKYDS
jgi:type IV secretory pathway ATPase VirB11/archaellum biosynthesis ATPase